MAINKIKSWRGLNNIIDPISGGIDILIQADNVNIDTTNRRVSRRKGYERILADSGIHSLHSHGDKTYYIHGVNIVKINSISGTSPAYTVNSEIVKTFASPPDRVSWHNVGNKIYFSDGIINGVIEDGIYRSWGMEIPSSPVGAIVSPGGVPGGLQSGQYRIAITYVRGDGQESGASTPITATVASNDSALDLSNISVPTDGGVTLKRIYMSTRNGTELYFVAEISIGDTTYSHYSDIITGAMLKTLNKRPPPPGRIISEYSGRLYIADGSIVYYSDPYGYELFGIYDFMQFEHNVTLIAPVNGGIYFSTEKETMFAWGDEPSKFSKKILPATGAVFGTLAYVDASYIGYDKVFGNAALWISKSGICAGVDNGVFINVSEKKYLPRIGPSGAAFIQRLNGIPQYISCVQQPEVVMYARNEEVTLETRIMR